MEKKFTVDGMMCKHCTAKVEKTLMAIPGVEKATADLETKVVTVELTEEVPTSVMFEAIEEKGFKPAEMA